MRNDLQKAIKKACIEAVKSLGPDYKKMSCLLFQWNSQESLPTK